MAIVASLDIVLRAQTDQANSKLLKSVDVIGRLKTALIGAASAYLSFAGASRAFSATLQGLGRLDTLAEEADKVSMSANSLRLFGNAAELAGASVDTVVRSISIMQRNIGNALRATGETVFDRIGVSVRDILQLQPEQQFIRLSEAIMALPSAAEQAAAAQAIFGRGAKDLIPLMRDAAGAIGDSADLINRFGGELTDLDITKVSLAQDAWDRLGQAIRLAWEALSVRFAESLAVIAASLTRLIEIMHGFGKVVTFVFESGVAKAALFISTALTLAAVIPIVTSAIVKLTMAIFALARAQTVAQSLLGPKGWFVILGAVAGAAVGLKMIEAEVDAFNKQLDKATAKQGVINRTPKIKFQFEEEKIEKKIITMRVNQEPIERGSQEDLTQRLAVDLKVERNVEKQQLDAQQNGNQILQDILEEIRKQTENMTGDADL